MFINFVIALRWINRTFNPTYLRCAVASVMTTPALILFFIAAIFAWTTLTGYKIPQPVRDLNSVLRASLLFVAAAIVQILVYRALAHMRRLGEFVAPPATD